MGAVYILYSPVADKFYIGSTKKLSSRIEYHKNKSFPGSFTTRYADWELFFQIDNLEIGVARKIESHLKRMKSRMYIKNLRRYPEISQKLIDKYNLLADDRDNK